MVFGMLALIFILACMLISLPLSISVLLSLSPFVPVSVL